METIGLECVINKGVLVIIFNNTNNDILHLPLTTIFFVEWRDGSYGDISEPKIVFSFGNGTINSISCSNAQECVLLIHQTIKDYYFKNKEGGI